MRDAVDRRVAHEWKRAGAGSSTRRFRVGGYPDYPRGTAAGSSDDDGMPDAWEEARGLDKSKPNANGRDIDPNYDNIEGYINGLVGPGRLR